MEDDPKVPFSVATTPRCSGGLYSFSWIVQLTLNPYLIIPRVKQGVIKSHFLSFWYGSTWIEPWSPGPLVNTLTIMPMDRYKCQWGLQYANFNLCRRLRPEDSDPVWQYLFNCRLWCYAAMCAAGLQDAVRSRQVHQLMQSAERYLVLQISLTPKRNHFFKLPGELLKVNTANWLAFPLKYKKGLWTAVFGLTRLITIFFYWIKERNKEKNNSGKSQEREIISVSWRSLH